MGLQGIDVIQRYDILKKGNTYRVLGNENEKPVCAGMKRRQTGLCICPFYVGIRSKMWYAVVVLPPQP
jgi:hypothetical protein